MQASSTRYTYHVDHTLQDWVGEGDSSAGAIVQVNADLVEVDWVQLGVTTVGHTVGEDIARAATCSPCRHNLQANTHANNAHVSPSTSLAYPACCWFCADVSGRAHVSGPKLTLTRFVLVYM